MDEQIGKPTYRIGIPATIFWILLAFIFDLCSLIPFVGDIVGPVFWVAASIYLWKIGCGFVNASRLSAEAISLVAKLIPVIQELPIELTGGIIAVILLVRLEDKTGVQIMKKGKIGDKGKYLDEKKFDQAVASLKRPAPLNSDGIREPQTGDTGQAGRTLNGNGVRQPNAQTATEQGGVRPLTARERSGMPTNNSNKKDNAPYSGGIKGGSAASEPAIKPTMSGAISGTMDSKKFMRAETIKQMREMQRARNIDMPITEEDIKNATAPGMDQYQKYTEKLDNAVSRYNSESNPLNKPTNTGSNTTNTSSSQVGTDSSTGMEWSHSGIIRKMDSATSGRAGRLADKIGKVAGVDGSIARGLSGGGVQIGPTPNDNFAGGGFAANSQQQSQTSKVSTSGFNQSGNSNPNSSTGSSTSGNSGGGTSTGSTGGNASSGASAGGGSSSGGGK